MKVRPGSTPVKVIVSGAQGPAGNPNHIASLIHAATAKTTPANGDEFAILDSATSFSLKKVTFANLKSTILSGVSLSWGSITGTLSAQTDLQNALDAKQPLDAALTALAAGSDFVQFTGPTTSTKVFTLPNAGATLLYSGGALGTPSSGTLTNCTIPASAITGTTLASNVVTSSLTSVGTISTGTWNATAIADTYISSAATWNAKQSAITFGTGVLTALGVNVGSAGSPVLNGGALGTPSSGTLTNCTIPSSGVTGLGTLATQNGTFTDKANLAGGAAFTSSAASGAPFTFGFSNTSFTGTAFAITKATGGPEVTLFLVNSDGVLSAPSVVVSTTLSAAGNNFSVDGSGNVTCPNLAKAPAVSAVGAADIDWSLGTVFTKTLGGNTTFTFSNIVAGKTILFKLTGASTFGVNWPAGITWAGATAPTAPSAGATVVYEFIADSSSTIRGFVKPQTDKPLTVELGGTGSTTAAGARTNLGLVIGTDVVAPNQNTTGSAATLTTPRTIGGSSFNGSADVTSFPAPGAIGGTTPASGKFTTLSAGTSPSGQASGELSTAISTTRGILYFGSDGSRYLDSANSTLSLNGINTLNFLGTGASSITGTTGNMTITSGTGNSRTMILRTTTSGGTATTALTLGADQSATFAAGVSVSGTTTATGGLVRGTFTVGTFPATTYLSAIVTDALAPVVGATVAAGGSAKALVMYNGTAKIVTAVL